VSVRITSLVWESALVQSHKLVMLALADHADHDGRNIYPSIARTAWKTGFSDRQVQRIIRSLESSGILVKTGEARQHFPAQYAVDLGRLPKRPPCEPDRGEPGVTSATPGVTSATSRGDIAVSPEPSYNRQNEPSVPGRARADKTEAAFERFWAAYPAHRRRDREACSAWWRDHIGPDEEAAVANGLVMWLISEEWTKEDGRFVPAPLKWLSDRRWMDHPVTINLGWQG
jgi:hypothetical protein